MTKQHRPLTNVQHRENYNTKCCSAAQDASSTRFFINTKNKSKGRVRGMKVVLYMDRMVRLAHVFPSTVRGGMIDS